MVVAPLTAFQVCAPTTPSTLMWAADALLQFVLRDLHRCPSLTVTVVVLIVELVPRLAPRAPPDADAVLGLQASHGVPGGRAEGPVHREEAPRSLSLVCRVRTAW